MPPAPFRSVVHVILDRVAHAIQQVQSMLVEKSRLAADTERASLLAEADRLYRRSEAGIALLPRDARMGIFAARLIYAGIGRQIRSNAHDTVTMRAVTTKGQKLGYLSLAVGRASTSLIMPKSAVMFAQPLEEVKFLVDATYRVSGPEGRSRADAVLQVLADLKARDMSAGTAAE